MKVLLGAILLLLVGCNGVVQAQGGDTDAQIAALTERVAELEDQAYQLQDWLYEVATEPLVFRMKRLAISQELTAEATAIARFIEPDSRNWNPQSFDYLVSQVQLYGPPYAASRCVLGGDQTVADFRDFVAETYARGIGPSGAAIWAAQLLDDDIKRQSDFDFEPRPCLKSYLSPEGLSDAGPAIELYLAAVIPSLPTRFQGGTQSLAVQRAAGWFNDTDRQESFIIWMCGRDSDNPCGLPTEEESPE